MNEEFLSYLWQFRHLSPDLKTESGDPITILHPGDRNTDGGPDFFNARLRIGDTIWAGNVEIHIRASNWIKHGHQLDHAYDNAILHVVYEADIPVNYSNGAPLQTLVIKNQFPNWIFDRYQQMMLNHQWIPCFNQLVTTTDHGFDLWAPSLAVERLVSKALYIKQLWENCRNNWEDAFYQHLGSAFGFKINSLQFELLTKSLPLKIVKKHGDDIFRLEALLFGQSGMLGNTHTDLYPKELLQEYLFLQKKYDLKPISESAWKFLRLRPTNFPTLRISQWANFLCSARNRFFDILEGGSFNQVIESLNISASSYWDTHYIFEKPSSFRKKIIGRNSVNLLVINGIVPFLFFYGLEKDQPDLREKALNFLEQADGEQNAVIVHWEEAGLPTLNAMQTQALLHLKKIYCDKKSCLNCRIGGVLLAK